MNKLRICLQVLYQPGFGYDLTPGHWEAIGYDHTVDPNWPSYEGIVRRAMVVVREAGIDPQDQRAVAEAFFAALPIFPDDGWA